MELTNKLYKSVDVRYEIKHLEIEIEDKIYDR